MRRFILGRCVQEAFLDSLAAAAVSKRGELTAQHCSSLCWAFGAVSHAGASEMGRRGEAGGVGGFEVGEGRGGGGGGGEVKGGGALL